MQVRLKLLVSFFAFVYVTGSVHSQPAGADCQYKKGVKDFLTRINCPGDYNYLKGKSLTEKFGQVASVKIVYSIRDAKVYFINSTLYPFHYDFCSAVLNNPDELSLFNIKNYSSNPGREYMLVNLNYYSWLGIYGLEIMPEDDAGGKSYSAYIRRFRHLYISGIRSGYWPCHRKWKKDWRLFPICRSFVPVKYTRAGNLFP